MIYYPYPQTPFPGKGLYIGATALDPVGGYAPATPFSKIIYVYRQSESPEQTLRAFVSGKSSSYSNLE